MHLIIKKTFQDLSKWAALYVMKRINKFNPSADKPFILGLPTGSTPLGMYKYLIKLCSKGKLSFKHVVTFNMDEYVDLPPTHEKSYHHFMWSNFFNHVDIDPKNVHILNGNADDLKEECQLYEESIQNCGGIDLFIGSVGVHGHIAFNEAGSSLASRTRVKYLAQSTIDANSRFFEGDKKSVPIKALTVGVQTVLDAKEIMLLISGARKAHALNKTVENGVNHMWTASAVQLHPRCLIVVDEDATGELKVKTVKYFEGIEKNLHEMDM